MFHLIIKIRIQLSKLIKIVAIGEYCAPKLRIVFGPGKSSGVLGNGPKGIRLRNLNICITDCLS